MITVSPPMNQVFAPDHASRSSFKDFLHGTTSNSSLRWKTCSSEHPPPKLRLKCDEKLKFSLRKCYLIISKQRKKYFVLFSDDKYVT